MKKTYQKPEILFENFTVSEQIAAASGGCEAVVTLLQQGCEATNNIFLSSALKLGVFAEQCELNYNVGSVEGLEALCYQGPPENSIYRS